jgi:hypothetical protein
MLAVKLVLHLRQHQEDVLDYEWRAASDTRSLLLGAPAFCHGKLLSATASEAPFQGDIGCRTRGATKRLTLGSISSAVGEKRKRNPGRGEIRKGGVVGWRVGRATPFLATPSAKARQRLLRHLGRPPTHFDTLLTNLFARARTAP